MIYNTAHHPHVIYLYIKLMVITLYSSSHLAACISSELDTYCIVTVEMYDIYTLIIYQPAMENI